MGVGVLCFCKRTDEHIEQCKQSFEKIIIIKDDPCLINYTNNDLNENDEKRLEDLVVSGSYKSSNKPKPFDPLPHIFSSMPKEENSNIINAINNFIETFRIYKVEYEGLKFDISCKHFFKNENNSRRYESVINLINDKMKLFSLLQITFNEILKFSKLIIESLERIKRNIKCTKYNNEITIFENYLSKKFYKNQTKDFEIEEEFIDYVFSLISENNWNLEDTHESEEIYLSNEENLKINFNFTNKSDFTNLTSGLNSVKNSIMQLRKMNEEFLYVLRELYKPFKELLEKLNRSTKIFNNNFDEDIKQVGKLLKFYNEKASKQLNKISYCFK
jgi:hypothetical protein